MSRLFQETPPITEELSLEAPNTTEPSSRSPPSSGKLTSEAPIRISIPLKSFLVIMLTTPAIASEPYTAEAPSDKISIRSTAAIGIEFKSCELPVEGDLGKRRPSTKISEREAPKPRKLICETPCAELPDCGRNEPAELKLVLRNKSETEVCPEKSIAARSITVTGTEPSRSVLLIREPVTAIRSTFSTPSSAAIELAENTAVEAAPKAIAKRTAFET